MPRTAANDDADAALKATPHWDAWTVSHSYRLTAWMVIIRLPLYQIVWMPTAVSHASQALT